MKRDAFFRALEAAARKRGALVMGICNVTPDSFSDGGRFLAPAAARAQVDRLLAEGADVLDLGAESTRPGAKPVSEDEQLARLEPALAHAIERGAVVSIDTQSPRVAEACLARGAHAVNDVSCLRDEGLADAAARHGAAYVLMHSRGTQEAMAGFSRYPDDAYDDVVRDVAREWSLAAARAEARGLTRASLIMDPGFGFAKNVRHSAELLARTRELVAAVGAPVLVGASRKSFLTLADPSAAPEERLGASIAAALFAVRAGATLVRVHDVRATCQALELEAALARTSASQAVGNVPNPRKSEEASA